MPSRLLTLPARGTLLVSPDLHGNWEDFARLRQVFTAMLAEDPDAQWVQLGDVVHGPDPSARRRWPDLYDFEDASEQVVQGFLDLQENLPGQVHVILGNHEWAHVGGRPTRKFWPDEVAALEERMGSDGVAALEALIARAPLLVATPCGALLGHACASDAFRHPDELADIALPTARLSHMAILDGLLRPRSQPAEVTARLLDAASQGGPPQRFLVHGHEIDPSGWFVEEGCQLGLTIFGTTPPKKHYLRLDLAARYESVHDLVAGRELLPLYDSSWVPTLP